MVEDSDSDVPQSKRYRPAARAEEDHRLVVAHPVPVIVPNLPRLKPGVTITRVQEQRRNAIQQWFACGLCIADNTPCVAPTLKSKRERCQHCSDHSSNGSCTTAQFFFPKYKTVERGISRNASPPPSGAFAEIIDELSYGLADVRSSRQGLNDTGKVAVDDMFFKRIERLVKRFGPDVTK